MELSINTLTLAMFAVQRDIMRHERLNNDRSRPQAEREDHGQYALDLGIALAEMAQAYESAQSTSPEMPRVDELLAKLDALVV